VNYATWQEAVRDAVVLASGVRDVDVFWAGTKEVGFAHKSPRISLSCNTFARIGRDEKRRKFTAPSTRTVAHVGNRRITISVRVESDDQAPGSSAVAVAGLLTTRIDFAAVRALLKPAKIVVLEVLPGVTRDYATQSRMLSVSVVDLICLAAESLLDTGAGTPDASWIETAHGEGELPGDLVGVELDA
jgi:hypothetical protein